MAGYKLLLETLALDPAGFTLYTKPPFARGRELN